MYPYIYIYRERERERNIGRYSYIYIYAHIYKYLYIYIHLHMYIYISYIWVCMCVRVFNLIICVTKSDLRANFQLLLLGKNAAYTLIHRHTRAFSPSYTLTYTLILLHTCIHTYIHTSSCVEKVSEMKFYLSRKKLTLNKTFTFLKIAFFSIQYTHSSEFSFVEALLKLVSLFDTQLRCCIFNMRSYPCDNIQLKERFARR